MYRIYGVSLRSLTNFAHEASVYDWMVNEEMNELHETIQDANEAGDSSHLQVPTEPSSADRITPERKIVSTYTLERICERLLGSQIEKMRKPYDAPRNNPTRSPAVGMIFEYQVQLFKEDRIIELLPIVSSDGGKETRYTSIKTDNGVAGRQFILPKSKELAFADDSSPPLRLAPTTVLEAPPSLHSTRGSSLSPLKIPLSSSDFR